MSQRAEQFTCECGKQFSNRNDLDRHRETCTTAQTSQSQRGGGQQHRGAGSSNPGSGSGNPGSSSGNPGSGNK